MMFFKDYCGEKLFNYFIYLNAHYFLKVDKSKFTNDSANN